ncbi:TPA: hypothetical protein N0F65_003693 [Lagenidium giganteum]|uniref:Uncharacterized protein n=1 Tax=Lagenidium giganteum TaxID=4803 RepID=A0AAV2YVB0_9STRA|nr:TPA: hypothetical protein N0F65_003693 [Lagenidium giganteum]
MEQAQGNVRAGKGTQQKRMDSGTASPQAASPMAPTITPRLVVKVLEARNVGTRTPGSAGTSSVVTAVDPCKDRFY